MKLRATGTSRKTCFFESKCWKVHHKHNFKYEYIFHKHFPSLCPFVHRLGIIAGSFLFLPFYFSNIWAIVDYGITSWKQSKTYCCFSDSLLMFAGIRNHSTRNALIKGKRQTPCLSCITSRKETWVITISATKKPQTIEIEVQQWNLQYCKQRYRCASGNSVREDMTKWYNYSNSELICFKVYVFPQSL